MKPQLKLKVDTILLVAAFAAVLVGCTTTPQRSGELEQARSLVGQIQASPDAGRYAEEELTAANEALRRADKLAKEDGSAGAIKDEAYLALRHAQIAQQQIERATAEAGMQGAEAQRQQMLSQAREQEAAAREQDAAAREREAAAQAQQARQETSMLQEQLRELQARQTDRGLVLTLGDVLFDTGKAALKPGAMGHIDRLAQFLQAAPERSVTIEGHTDSVGSEGSNQVLSEKRAGSVRGELLSRGVTPDSVRAVGMGESAPVASNDNAAGRQQNRRVEIIIANSPVAAR